MVHFYKFINELYILFNQLFSELYLLINFIKYESLFFK